MVILACSLGVNLIYTMTEPKTPDSQKLEVYTYGYAESEEMTVLLERLRVEYFDADQKEYVATTIIADETYGDMLLSTRIFSGEGDILILPKANYQNYASDGLFIPLEDVAEITGTADRRGINLERSWRRNSSSGVRHLYGIPLQAFPSLTRYFPYGTDYYVSIRSSNGNDDNALKLFILLLELEP